MALTPGGRAPYAPFKAVQTVIARHRAVGLPKVDVDILMRLGITEPLRPRTLASLKMLDFYDEEGRVTPEFDYLQRVPEAEFSEHLGQLLRKAYAPVIEVVGDPAAASAQSIDDAFRTFEPRGQLVRMVQLFTGLMAFAGIMNESAKRRPGPNVAARPARTKPTTVRSSAAPAPLPSASVPSPHSTYTATGDSGHKTIVTLGDAGSVALVVDVNPLVLLKADRDFLFALVDKIEEWRNKGHHDEGTVT